MWEATLDIAPEVAAAQMARKPVVALESALVTHGLPRPLNLETALAAERAVREEGAVPALIAVIDGRPVIGLERGQLDRVASDTAAHKVSRRNLAQAISTGWSAGTTVSATMWLAHRAGLGVIATGGIGGAHRQSEQTEDISADIIELGRVPIVVVCAGAKSLLDIGRTLEILETYSVPVLCYGTDRFPGFYGCDSGWPAPARVETVEQAAGVIRAHWGLGGAGMVIAQPPDHSVSLEPKELDAFVAQAESEARDQGIWGAGLTPFVLRRLAELSQGRTVIANQALVVANARLAAQLACEVWR